MSEHGSPANEDSRLVEAVTTRLSLESSQFSPQAYDRRKTMLGVTAVVFALTAGGFHPSQFSAAGFALKAADELSLLGFAILILTYSIGDFWLFSFHEIAGLKAELDRFQSAFGAGAESIRELWQRLHANAVRNEGPNSALTHEIERRMKSGISSHASLVRKHRMRVLWESAVPIAIACATDTIGLTYLLVVGRSVFK